MYPANRRTGKVRRTAELCPKVSYIPRWSAPLSILLKIRFSIYRNSVNSCTLCHCRIAKICDWTNHIQLATNSIPPSRNHKGQLQILIPAWQRESGRENQHANKSWKSWYPVVSSQQQVHCRVMVWVSVSVKRQRFFCEEQVWGNTSCVRIYQI